MQMNPVKMSVLDSVAIKASQSWEIFLMFSPRAVKKLTLCVYFWTEHIVVVLSYRWLLVEVKVVEYFMKFVLLIAGFHELYGDPKIHPTSQTKLLFFVFCLSRQSSSCSEHNVYNKMSRVLGIMFRV